MVDCEVSESVLTRVKKRKLREHRTSCLQSKSLGSTGSADSKAKDNALKSRVTHVGSSSSALRSDEAGEERDGDC